MKVEVRLTFKRVLKGEQIAAIRYLSEWWYTENDLVYDLSLNEQSYTLLCSLLSNLKRKYTLEIIG